MSAPLPSGPAPAGAVVPDTPPPAFRPQARPIENDSQPGGGGGGGGGERVPRDYDRDASLDVWVTMALTRQDRSDGAVEDLHANGIYTTGDLAGLEVGDLNRLTRTYTIGRRRRFLKAVATLRKSKETTSPVPSAPPPPSEHRARLPSQAPSERKADLKEQVQAMFDKSFGSPMTDMPMGVPRWVVGGIPVYDERRQNRDRSRSPPAAPRRVAGRPTQGPGARLAPRILAMHPPDWRAASQDSDARGALMDRFIATAVNDSVAAAAAAAGDLTAEDEYDAVDFDTAAFLRPFNAPIKKPYRGK